MIAAASPRRVRTTFPPGVPALAAFSTAALGAGLARALVTTYLPVLLEQIRDAPGLIGTVMLVNAVAGFVVPLWIGVWSDRLASRGVGRAVPFVLGGSLLTALALVAIAFGHASSYALLALFGLTVYVGLNAITTAHRALIPEAFPPTRRAGATGAEELAMLIGGLVGLVVGGILVERAGWAPFVFGALMVPLLALPTVARMRGIRPAVGHREADEPGPRALVAMARRPGVRAVLLAQALWVFGYLGLPPFFVLYSDHVLGLSPSAAGVVLALFGVATGAAMLGAGKAQMRAHVPLLLFGVLLMGIGLLAVAPASTLAAAAPGLAGAAVGFGIVSTLGFPVLARFIPPGEEGSYTALYFSVRAVAAAVAVPAAGWMIAASGSYRVIALSGGAVTLVALVPLAHTGVADRRFMARFMPGLRAIVAGCVLVTGLVAATALVGLVITQTPLQRVDAWLFEAMQGGSVGEGMLSAVLDEVALANYLALTLVALVAGYRRRLLLPTVLLVPGSGLLAWGVVRAVWAVVERERPEEVLGSATVHSWAYVSSFPSGHIAVTVAMVAATGWLFPRLGWGLWAYAAVLSASRIVFGAHFPTDVVVGAAVGYVAFLLTRRLLVESGLRVTRATVEPRPHADPHEASARGRTWASRAAIGAGVLIVACFFSLAGVVGFPQSADGVLLPLELQSTLQHILLDVAGLGLLLAIVRPRLGGAVVVAAALPFGILAAFEYAPSVALVAFLALFVPGTVILVSSIRTRAGLVVLGSLLALVVASGGMAADWTHAYLTGPTHPASTVEVPAAASVRWVWAGGTTETEFRVNARLDERPDVATLRVERADGGEAQRIPGDLDEDMASFRVTGLRPDTEYRYAVEVDGSLDDRRTGRVRTFPAGPSSFTFAFSSCARVGSNGSVFDAIRRDNPLFFLAVGDLFYGNVSRDDPGAFESFYDRLLSQPAPGLLFRSTSMAYVWDDHDFGGNGASSLSESGPAAESVYRERTPHYSLPGGSERGPIFQAFDVGRVRFLLTDTRSQRDPQGAPDDSSKTMLGPVQKEWLKRELLIGRDRSSLVVWVNPDPWIGAPEAGGDSWAGYATERRELSEFIAANEIDNVLMLSGDAHMLAIDDGRNTDYSGTGRAGFPLMHAAALDRRGGVKGGPYSEGVFPGSGHYGLVTVRDTGDRVSVALSGRNYLRQELVGHTFTIPATAR